MLGGEVGMKDGSLVGSLVGVKVTSKVKPDEARYSCPDQHRWCIHLQIRYSHYFPSSKRIYLIAIFCLRLGLGTNSAGFWLVLSWSC